MLTCTRMTGHPWELHRHCNGDGRIDRLDHGPASARRHARNAQGEGHLEHGDELLHVARHGVTEGRLGEPVGHGGALGDTRDRLP